MPWGGGKFVPLKLKAPTREPSLEPELPGGATAELAAAPAVVLPPGVEPLVLWEPPAGVEGQPVRVDDMLTQVGLLQPPAPIFLSPTPPPCLAARDGMLPSPLAVPGAVCQCRGGAHRASHWRRMAGLH